MASEGWGPPPAGPIAIPPDEVHVWRVRLDPPAAVLARLEPLLAPDERARASRFRFPEHRRAFVAGRGAQREILARYTGVPPASLAYAVSPHGKLSLVDPGGIRFNVSNAGALALVAVARDRELGVDLEALKPMPDGIDIARRFFSAPENAVFAALPEGEREAAFFRCWTRKEAVVKAVGEGLSMPLDRFDVAFGAGEDARILAWRGDAALADRWRLLALEPGDGYVGALAMDGNRASLRRFDWG